LPNVLLVNYAPPEKTALAQFLSSGDFLCLPAIPSMEDNRLLKPFERGAGKHGVDLVLIDLSRSTDGKRGTIVREIRKVHLFLKRIREMNSTACVILTGPPIPLDKVSQLLRYGVYDYLCSPLSLKRLVKTMEHGLKNKAQAEEIIASLARANRQLELEKDHLKKWSESLRLIDEINQTVAGSLQIDDLICAFGEGIKKLIPYDTLAVFLKGHDEPDRAWIWAKPEKNQRSGSIQFLKRLQQETVAWGNKYLLSDTASLETRIKRQGEEMIVPLFVAGEKVGLLRIAKGLANKSDIPFGQDHVHIVSKVVTPLCLTLNNAHMYQRVNALALTDELTSILNRRAFLHLLEREYKRFIRSRTPFTLLLIDLDAFKGINDCYGHIVGDVVLKESASLLKHAVREIDILARYGGEEFVVILPETGLKEGLIVAERIRHLVALHLFNKEKSPIRITVSIGIVMLPSRPVESSEAFLHLADLALYQAKKKGRNRVESGSPITEGEVIVKNGRKTYTKP